MTASRPQNIFTVICLKLHNSFLTNSCIIRTGHISVLPLLIHSHFWGLFYGTIWKHSGQKSLRILTTHQKASSMLNFYAAQSPLQSSVGAQSASTLTSSHPKSHTNNKQAEEGGNNNFSVFHLFNHCMYAASRPVLVSPFLYEASSWRVKPHIVLFNSRQEVRKPQEKKLRTFRKNLNRAKLCAIKIQQELGLFLFHGVIFLVTKHELKINFKHHLICSKSVKN